MCICARRDGNGTLDLRELLTLCRDLVGELTQYEAGFVQALLDADGNGRISMGEFVKGARDAIACFTQAQRAVQSNEMLQLLNAVSSAVAGQLSQFWSNYMQAAKANHAK